MAVPASVYQLFRRSDGGAPSVKLFVIAMVIVAVVFVGVGVVRVTREHEVLRLGFQLSKQSEKVRALREERRQLELELATYTAPDRIRKLALQLGMTPVAPDKIRIVGPRKVAGL
ncbi:MAG TPA: cell division protein FtsL [Kofleriaceae bacterium]|jgi:cell division protein FtsL